MEKFSEIIHIAAISQAFLLGVYFFHHRRRAGDIYFSGLMFSLVVLMMTGYLYLMDYIFYVPALARLGYPILALPGPFYYLGVRGRLEGENRFRLYELCFFLIPLLSFLYILPYFFWTPGEQIQYIKDDFESVHLDSFIRSLLALVNDIFFVGLGFTALLRRRQKYDGAEAGLFYLSIGVLCMLAVLTVLLLFNSQLFNNGFHGTILCTVFIVFAYLGVHQTRLLLNENRKPSRKSGGEYERYARSRMSADDVKKNGEFIQAYFARERPYMDLEFKIKTVADRLGLSLNQTSQVINRYFESSFTELVNKHRTELARELLADPTYAEYSVLRVGLECGFNSQSSFNSLFKKHIGQTPGQFRKTVKST